MSLNRKQMLNCCATFAGLFSVRQKPSPTSVLSTIKTEKYQKWNPLFQGRLIKEILKYGTPTYNFLAENDPFFFFVSICEAICRCPPAYIHLQLVERSCQLAKNFRFVLIKKLYRYNALNNFSRSFSEDLRSLRKVIRSEESIEQIATKK